MAASDSDTIVAVATAPGEGGIGIVRLSGSGAIRVAESCFSGRRRLKDADSHRMHLGRFRHASQDLDQVLACVMYGPHSFTGEDTVEFHCHGGPYLLRRICQALLQSGARQAERGEFTKRAYLNGKIDLTQAEAIADLIGARADSSLESAYFRLRGDLRIRFEGLRERLLTCRVLLEADLDFSDEVAVDREKIAEEVVAVADAVDTQISRYRTGRLLREGARITLCGRPNVGKSSLMNRLLGEDRAIVTEIPGTTRDTLEEAIRVGGILAHLVDTAGIRETTDPVEREGTRRSQISVEKADLALLIVDGSTAPTGEDEALLRMLEPARALLVLNKNDIGLHAGWDAFAPGFARTALSARTGDGVDALRRLLQISLESRAPDGADSITHERHVEALRQCREALTRAATALSQGEPGEIVAYEITEAAEPLGDIVGLTTAQDVLTRIFSTFCIGK